MIFKPKRLIILGSSGFIGKHLYERFSRDTGIKVLGYSSSTCDLLAPNEVRKILFDITRDDAVIMLSTINRLDENSYNSMCKNLKMAENVSLLLEERPVGLVIFFSSIDVYGVNIGDDEKIDEDRLPDPGDYYSISKLTSEYLLKRVCVKNGISLKILRLSGVYGAGDKGRSTVGSLLNAALKNDVSIYGRGENLRDFVYIDDVYNIVRLLINGGGAGLLNVATGKSYSILQIVDMMKSLLPDHFKVEFKAELGSASEKRVKNLVFDTSLLKKCFPGLILTDIRQGLALYSSVFKIKA